MQLTPEQRRAKGRSWTCESLAQCVLDRHPELGTFDASTWRYLHDSHVRPHHEEMWLHRPNPAFRERVAAICALYLKVPPGSVVLNEDGAYGILGDPCESSPDIGNVHIQFGMEGRLSWFDWESSDEGDIFAFQQATLAPS